MQANASSQSLFDTAMKSISNIQNNKDMNPDTKQQNINQITQTLKSGLSLTGNISNLNLSGLLDFSNIAA